MVRPSVLVDDVREELREGFLSRLLGTGTTSMLMFVAVFIAVLFLAPKLFETTDAGTYKVLQKPVTGTMKAYTKPGMFVQGFGDVFDYKAADALHFAKEGRGAVSVRFNDGAQSDVVVNTRYELPNNPDKLIEIHKKFRNYDALVRETIEQVVRESVMLSAALMSAEESYTTKRAEFSQLAQDQVVNGVYLTEAQTIETTDKKTGEVVKRQIVNIQKDKDGRPLRKEAVLDDYGIRIVQFVVQEIDYSPEVDGMIQAKQKALQETVSAKAQAEKATQDKLTAEEVGKKNVAVAKYEQEVEKAKAITAAEKELEVSKLNRQAAEQNKAALIAKGEGEGEYKRKVFQADGALQQKLAAYVETQKAWAEAFANSKNPVVPGVVMGNQAAGGNAALNLMEIMAVKAAKDLSVNPDAK